MSRDVFICDAIRTPIGRFGGALAPVRADDLAAIPFKALIERNPQLDLAAIDEVFLGCANQAGEDNRNVARMALLLAGIPDSVPGVTLNRLCASGLDAVEHGDSLVFMHAVKEGPANRSFGLQVAALAGLPRDTVAQARRRLAELEQRGGETHAAQMAPQSLDAPQQFGLFTPTSAALDALQALDPDELTPKQAMEALYRLKAML